MRQDVTAHLTLVVRSDSNACFTFVGSDRAVRHSDSGQASSVQAPACAQSPGRALGVPQSLHRPGPGMADVLGLGLVKLLANGPAVEIRRCQAVHVEPAGEHVVRGPLPEVHEGGQEPVDEHEPVLRAGAHRPLPRPGRKAWPYAVHATTGQTATSSAITSAERPVILRSLTIAAREAFPTTRP